eukprot:GEMP01036924.1.p1 GENE.GEMP01036924.1~~GEMP01036924.1.p1  ORF type:complete len:307 (+),score=69.51 GEMP01036924.1:231-1151(+)
MMSPPAQAPTKRDMYIAASQLSAAQFFEFYETFNLNLVVHRGEAEVALSRFANDLEFRQFLHVLLQLAEIGFSRAPYKAENEEAPKDLRMLLFKISRFMGLHDPHCAFRKKMPALKWRRSTPRRRRRLKEPCDSQPSSSPCAMNRPSPVWSRPVERSRNAELPQGRPPRQPHAPARLPKLIPPPAQKKLQPHEVSNIRPMRSEERGGGSPAVIRPMRSEERGGGSPAVEESETPIVNVLEPIKGPRRRLSLLVPLKPQQPLEQTATEEPEATPRVASEPQEPDVPKPGKLRLLKKRTEARLLAPVA